MITHHKHNKDFSEYKLEQKNYGRIDPLITNSHL